MFFILFVFLMVLSQRLTYFTVFLSVFCKCRVSFLHCSHHSASSVFVVFRCLCISDKFHGVLKLCVCCKPIDANLFVSNCLKIGLQSPGVTGRREVKVLSPASTVPSSVLG